MAAEEAFNEGVPHLWQERWAQQQLTQAPPAEGAQEDIFGKRRLGNDLGDTKGNRGNEDWVRQGTVAHRMVPMLHLMVLSSQSKLRYTYIT